MTAADVRIGHPAALNREEVQATMVNFVVDQTGYPAEMVELDADLEADLGIDSIKKAQLIGELAENFQLNHLAGQLQTLSLDDFRTIRSILDLVTAPVSAAPHAPQHPIRPGLQRQVQVRAYPAHTRPLAYPLRLQVIQLDGA